MTRPNRAVLAITLALSLAGCAAMPELDGRPTTAMRAGDFMAGPVATRAAGPGWQLDFGDAGLRRMLAEAGTGSLDLAAARARLVAADLTAAQAARGGLRPGAEASADREGLRLAASLGWEPDLAGRFQAALSAARLEQAATGLDLALAQRVLSREIALGWIALGQARTESGRLDTEIATERQSIALLSARRAAGEITGGDLAARRQSLVRAEGRRAGMARQIALAEARLGALGVRTVPTNIGLRAARRPAIAASTDLGPTRALPQVCAAWLRLAASDAARAETLAAARPRVVATATLAATAKSLAGLASGNVLALGHLVRVEGTLADGGETRTRLDQARLGVAQAEIEALRGQVAAELAALEALATEQAAEATLSAALRAHEDARAERDRIRARHAAGIADGLDLAEGERAVQTAQRDIDMARAEALRAAVLRHDALPPVTARCPIMATE